MQLRFDTGLTSEEYVKRQAWREARLERCPRHPGGGCGFRRHGSYARKSPPGARVPRWYCRKTPETFSALPDCLAARLPGTLVEVEAVVRAVEASASLEAAVETLRPEIDLPSVLRWTRRRVQPTHRALTALRGLMPQTFAARPATLGAFGEALGVETTLVRLRGVAAEHLQQLPAPLGFARRPGGGGERTRRLQHSMGPDPPEHTG